MHASHGPPDGSVPSPMRKASSRCRGVQECRGLHRTGGVQPRMNGEEECDSPFFLRQESHALGRFCTVDMAVTIKGSYGLRTPGVHVRSVQHTSLYPLFDFSVSAGYIHGRFGWRCSRTSDRGRLYQSTRLKIQSLLRRCPHPWASGGSGELAIEHIRWE